MSELITPKERCDTCAFREGTEASKDEITRLKVSLCLQSRTPFNCHEAPGGIAGLVVCRGFLDAITASPEKPNIAEWKQDLAGRLLEVIENVETDPDRFADGAAIETQIRNVIDAMSEARA